MTLTNRLFSSLVVLTALSLTFFSLSAEWLFELYPITDQSGNRVTLFDLYRKGDQITREVQISIEHTHSKEMAADALFRRETTLLDAAVLFRSLYEDPKSWHDPQRSRPRRDDGEGWCRFVIEWTDMKIRDEQSPTQADALRQRLEAELQRHLACQGTVKLPE
jgi:hypothetical protein